MQSKNELEEFMEEIKFSERELEQEDLLLQEQLTANDKTGFWRFQQEIEEADQRKQDADENDKIARLNQQTSPLFDSRSQSIENQSGSFNSNPKIEQNLGEEGITNKVQEEEAREMEVMKSHFTFRINDTLSLENIIRATFENPNRKKFQNSGFMGKKYTLSLDSVDQDVLIERIRQNIPLAFQKFNKEQIQVGRLYFFSEEKRSHWLAKLHEFSWYGPFSFSGTFVFQTATDSGILEGLVLIISLSGYLSIDLYPIDGDGEYWGGNFNFSNK